MYIINTIPHGKCFVRYLRTRCFCIRNLTRSLRSLVRFLIRQQLVGKYSTPALSMKYSLFILVQVLHDNRPSTFFFQLLTSTCKSVIQRQYSQKASKDNSYFLHQLAKFLRTLTYAGGLCACRGNIWPPTIPMSINFHDFAEQCLC